MAGLLLICSTFTAKAQTFQVNGSPVPVAVAKGVTPLPVKLPIVAGPSGLDLTGLTAQSNSAWVVPTVDTETSTLVLTFSTDSLTAGNTYTAALTVSNGTHSSQLYVTANVAALNVTVLRDDPTRSRTYAIHQNGLNVGAILVFDPIAQTYVGSITVGIRPNDLAVSADGSELLVICGVNQKIFTIDLPALAVSGAITLPGYTDLDPNATVADVAYGPGNIIYYTDGAWAPKLHVLNRSTGTVLQSALCGPNVINSSTAFGFGDIAVSSDQKTLFAWAQYGWSAGIASSFAAQFTINTDGTVTRTAVNIPAYPAFSRDPLNTPILLSSDGRTAVMKDHVFNTSAIATTVRTFNGMIYSMSPNAEVVSTQSAIYETSTGRKLYDLPAGSTVQTMTSDYARLVYWDGPSKMLRTVDLLHTLGDTVLGRITSPANQAVTTPPHFLQWPSQTGIDRYRVYLGTSSNAVAQATPDSPEYQGEVTGQSFRLNEPLAPETTYFWRIDPISGNEVATGAVVSFSVATIASSVTEISSTTVQGFADQKTSIELSSATPGKTWTTSTTTPWIKFANSTGVTPSTLQITLDASTLTPGVHEGSITITANDGAFSIPVSLQVDSLTLTVLKSDPASIKVYALSEAAAASGGTSRAYLLEVDTVLKKISRLAYVGTGATDLALHQSDNRIYVTNWRAGVLLAVGLDGFNVERTYAVPPFTGSGYSHTDVYRISAGRPGQLVVEAAEQSINMSIFNTQTGTVSSSSWQQAGGGAHDPTRRYYYHGEYDSGLARIRKFDANGDAFVELVSNRGTPLNFYGSRNVVVSGDGQHIFWNGSAYTPDLVEESVVGAQIYSTTMTGRFAFGSQSIYDLNSRSIVMTMPVVTTLSAYNTRSNTLVVPKDGALDFYIFNEGGAQPPPELSVGTISHDSIQLTWNGKALETGSILQKRGPADFEWTDVGPAFPPYTTTATVNGLARETNYGFRVKTINPLAAFTQWSNEVQATTLIGPPVFTTPSKLVFTAKLPVDFQVSASGTDNVYTVTGLPPGMSFNESTGKITGISSDVGHYVVTVTATNQNGSSTLTIDFTIGVTTQGNTRGRYAGLVGGDVLLTGSWTLDRTGNAFTGTYNCSGGLLKFKGSFPAGGDIRQTQIKGRLSGVDIRITAIWDRAIDRVTFDIGAFDIVVPTFEDTGFASSWDARARPYSKTGVFNAVMLPSETPAAYQPEGYGFLSLTFANTGAVKIQGETALGNKITWSGPLLDNYILPLYWKSSDSILWGLISTSSNDDGAPPVFGALGWVAVSNPKRKAYTYGFEQGLDVLGSRFTAGKASTDLFKTPANQMLQLGSGGMDRMMETLVQPFGVSGKKIVLPAGNPYQMKLTLTPKTGLVTGSVVVMDPNPSGGAPAKRTVTFRGIMIRKTHPEGMDAVGGYFLMPPDWNGQVRSGWMEITAPLP